ncbi:MAG: DUF1934 domain-containing protein [Lactobacillaceae bacterium]|jgi:uncharacterized beta-barrel protein YwiB (DUF1934 family)|nr:DUF1934 domain-containing protein [Lactobacillaceae bacterium]
MPEDTKTIEIHLTTSIKQGDEFETFTFDETGSLTNKDGAIYIRYVEHGETTVPVTLKVNLDQTLLLNRDGQSKLHLHLDPKQTLTTHYLTQLGMITLKVRTQNLEIDLANGSIRANYELLQGETVTGSYTLDLTFE